MISRNLELVREIDCEYLEVQIPVRRMLIIEELGKLSGAPRKRLLAGIAGCSY